MVLVCVPALLGGITAYAQEQAGILSLQQGVPISEPTSPINLSTHFIPSTDENIYSVLDPALQASRLEIFDSLANAGFTVNASMSDLKSGNDIVSYTKANIVTLSQSGGGIDYNTIFNNPPGAPNVTADAKCTDWTSGDPLSVCDAFIDANPNNTRFYETSPSSSMLTADANPGDTTIDVGDGSQFTLPAPGDHLFVSIDDDVITYTGINVNQLTGVTGIDASHLSGSTVNQHSPESGQLTIMNNAANPADVGLYWVGLGIRLKIDPTLKQGDYSGTLTFTFILI